MLSLLITSKSRVEIITWFVTHPGDRFHYNELIRILKASPPSIQNEPKRLETAGFLISKKEANVRFYWVNQDFILYPEIKSIILKTVGLADQIKGALSRIGHIESAFIYGSVAKNLEDMRSDIDLMVIGEIDIDELHEALSKVEETLGREINPTVFDSKEWQQRLKKQESFVTDVINNQKIFLIGNEDGLRRLTKA